MRFRWDDKKNRELKSEGRPSFEDAVTAIANSGVLREDENPIHPNQRIFIVLIDDYPHVIPFEIRGDVFWLITVYPARKYKK
jgi:uncharacterized DUF497 family protein